jgi:hypothetical protein
MIYGNVGNQTMYVVDVQNKGKEPVKSSVAAIRQAAANRLAIQSRSVSVLVMMRASERSWRNIASEVSKGLAYGASSLLGVGAITGPAGLKLALPMFAGFMELAGGKIKDSLNPLAIDKFTNEACADRFEVPANEAVTCLVLAKREKTEATVTVELK